MKSPLKKSIGEVVTDYGARVMKVFKKGLLQRSLFDFYGDVKADKLRVKESASVPATPIDGDGGVLYTKSADGKLYYKSNEVAEVELSANGGTVTTTDTPNEGEALVYNDSTIVWGHPEKIHLQVRNDEGSTIPSGAPLYSKGETGGSNRILVGICDADDSAKMPCIGLAEAEMNTTSTKDNFAITQGIYNTNISGFTGLAVGDTLYVDTSGSAPYLTKTKPTGESSLIQNVGIVVKTNGTICQGLQVSAIGRTNDVPNLNSGYIFYGNGSNQASSTQLSTLLPPDLTVSGTGTINANNVPTLNQDTTGNAATATSATSAATATNAVSSKGIQGGTGVDVDISSDVDINITSNGEVTVKLDSDNNESNQKFKITNNADATVFHVQEDGDVYLSGDTITNSASNNDLNIESDGSMTFTLDRDDDEIGKSFSFKNFNAELVNISDRGDMQVNGVITGKIKQMFNMSFHDDIGTTKHWMPWSGTLEQNLNAYQEEVAMAMPYGGRILSCLVRSQAINSSGNLTIGIETKEPGATVGSSWTSEETETLSVASTDANHAFHFVFGSQTHFDPGDLVAISIQSSSDLSNYTYWYVTTVVEFDLNDILGVSSAEYDTGQ